MNRQHLIVAVGVLAAGAAALLWALTAPDTGPAVQDSPAANPNHQIVPPSVPPPPQAETQAKLDDPPPRVPTTTRLPVLLNNNLPVVTRAEEIQFAENPFNEEKRPVFFADKRGIGDAVRMGISDIKACYETFRATSPELEGRLVMEFTIDGHDGGMAQTTNVVVGSDSNMDHIWLEGCIATVFEEFRFDLGNQEGPINVAYPLQFSSE